MPSDRRSVVTTPAARSTALRCQDASLFASWRVRVVHGLLDYEKEQAKERQGEPRVLGYRPRRVLYDPALRARSRVSPIPPSSPQKGPTREDRRKAVNKAGERLGVSGKSVERAGRVAAENPELHEKVKRGEVSLNAAHHEVSGERTKRERAEDQPLSPPKTERQKQQAAAARERLDGAITQIGTLASAVLEIDLTRAIAVADGDTRTYWQKTVRDAARNLRNLNRLLEGTG